MGGVVERRQGEVHRRSTLGGVSAYALADLAHIEGIGGAGKVAAVELGATDGDEDDVVLSPLGLHLMAHRGLDVGSLLAPLTGRGDAVLGEKRIDLFVAGVPHLFLASSHRVVFEKQIRLIGGQQLRIFWKVCHWNSPCTSSFAAQFGLTRILPSVRSIDLAIAATVSSSLYFAVMIGLRSMRPDATRLMTLGKVSWPEWPWAP